MNAEPYLKFLVEEIHSVIFATIDTQGHPLTCAIDLMDHDAHGLYFLTATGKSFYHRLKRDSHIALSGMKGKDTLSCVSISLQGQAREIGTARLPRLFALNPYMEKIYPTEASRRALTVFCIEQGSGEWFDLSKSPIKRASFAFGDIAPKTSGYFVSDPCTGCGRCLPLCPQQCVDVFNDKAVIEQAHCLHCGNCMQACPFDAVTFLK